MKSVHGQPHASQQPAVLQAENLRELYSAQNITDDPDEPNIPHRNYMPKRQ